MALNSSGRPDEALKRLGEALARHPGNVQILTLLVEISQQQNDFPAALRYAERLAALEPDDADLKRFVDRLRAQAQ